MERLILLQINEVVHPQLPHILPGFRSGWCTQDQVLQLTQDIENALESGKKIWCSPYWSVYNTVWHDGLTAKLLEVIPCRLMMWFIQDMISNQSFILQVWKKISCLKHLHNDLPQGSLLAPFLFIIYIYTYNFMQAKKCVYIDTICIADTGNDFQRIEGNLNQDMSALTTYFHQWR